MLRKKPTTRLDVIGKLNLEPIPAIPLYAESKAQEKYFIKPPDYDSCGDSIELMYISNELEHRRMLELQQDMIKQDELQVKINKKRAEVMAKRISKLHKRIYEVDSFTGDCRDKREATEKDIKTEERRQRKLGKRIVKLEEETKVLSEFREELQATADDYKVYESVLEDVVEQSDTFESIEDCINRCDALMMVQVETNKIKSEKLEEIDEMRQRMLLLTREAGQKVLGLKTELDKNARVYNNAKASISTWEAALRKGKRMVHNHETTREITIEGINQLYHMLCMRSFAEQKFKRREVELQLDFIREEVMILQEVLQKCLKQQAGKTKRISSAKMHDVGC